jgi:hypothetical protein
MSKKIAILTDATAPMETKLRRDLRQCRGGPPWRPDDEDPAPSIGFAGDSGFTMSASVPRIPDPIAALCCEGEVEAFPGSLGVIIRA